MIITLFNGLSGLQVRGISKVADEIAYHLRLEGHKVIEVKIPKILYFRMSILRIIMMIFFQQVICPLIAIKNRSDLVIDPYNGFPVLSSIFIKTKYFIHDYTPFKRRFWYIRPGTLYQFALFKLDMCLSLAEMYHDALDVETPHFLRRSTSPKIFPCIVDPLDTSTSTFFEENIEVDLMNKSSDYILITSISGSGWNKDFDGLINHLASLDRKFLLVAFGFGEQSIRKIDVPMAIGMSYVFTVGFVDEAAIASTILRSQLFVFHSLSEGFGRPILEALQLEKLVVTIEAPVVGLLSIEARQNLFIYRSKNEFKKAFIDAFNAKFVKYSSLYKEGIDFSLKSFLA